MKGKRERAEGRRDDETVLEEKSRQSCNEAFAERERERERGRETTIRATLPEVVIEQLVKQAKPHLTLLRNYL